MIGLAVVLDGVLPAAERSTVQGAPSQYKHVMATADEDGGDIFVELDGDLTIDLSSWPASEWSGMQFKTSNPSVLTRDTPPSAGGPPIASFSAHRVGASGVDATSAYGGYTFELRVTVFSP